MDFIRDLANGDKEINRQIKENNEVVGYKVEVRNKEDKLNNQDGPALLREINGMKYAEWWSRGELIATYNEKTNEFKMSTDGTHASLKEAVVPEKWHGMQSTLDLSDINLCTIKPEIKEKENYSSRTFIRELPIGKIYHSDVTENNQIIGYKMEVRNNEGKLNNQDGPALETEINGMKYAEWWSKGELVAIYDGKTNQMKKSVDGTHAGLKEAVVPQKWNSMQSNLDLNDISVCSIKPEVQMTPKESVMSRLQEIRMQAMPEQKNQITMKI